MWQGLLLVCGTILDLIWALVKWVGGFVMALLLLTEMGWIAWEQTPDPCREPPAASAREHDPLGIR